MVNLPHPVFDIVDYSLEIEGDEEYWIQNLTADNGGISDRSGPLREKDGSVIEYVDQDEAHLSYIASSRERTGNNQESHALQPQGAAFGDDLSAYKSMNATE